MKLLKKILNLFSLKCPSCNSSLKQDEAHVTRFCTIIKVYECVSCKKQVI